MKKLEKLKAKRYYQRDFGLFVDIERCGGKTNIYLGTTMNRECSVASDMPIAGRALCCTLYEGNEQSFPDKDCMEAFEKICGRFKSAYIFWYITDELCQPYDDCFDNSLDMDDFCELEITRYKHKAGKEKFYLDVEICRNPEEPDDVRTNIYIMDPPGYSKILCDRYAYEVPKQEHKDILKKNLMGYIWTYRQEMVDQEYYIPFHEKPGDGGSDYAAIEELMGELPFQ